MELLARMGLIGGLIGALAGAALAHPLAPCLLDLHENAPGRYDVVWKTPRLRAPGTQLTPILPDTCRSTSAPATMADNDSLRIRWSISCSDDGIVGASISVAGMSLSSDAAVIRVGFLDGRVVQGVVSARQPVFTVPPRPNPVDVLRDYLSLGGHHILSGMDHLLFVFGLFLLATTLSSLLATITAFTFGHCLTLSLAALGVITPPSRWIEVGIALSVFALAVELARAHHPSSLLRRFPWAMSLTFGLLHGLGFAAGLREAGLPSGEVPLSLAAFNAGIEAGQIAFVTLLLAAHMLLRQVRWQPPPWMQAVPVYAMGSLAAFWTFERAAVLLR